MTFTSQQGFSFLEVATTTALMGILAAAAIPKFIDVKDDAQTNVFKSLASSIQNAAQYAHLKQTTSGVSENHSILMNDQIIEMNNAYPTLNSISLLVDTSDHFQFDAKTGSYHWQTSPTDCSVRYIPNLLSSQQPQVVITQSGCHKTDANIAAL